MTRQGRFAWLLGATLALGVILGANIASAAETLNYTYDALGRVTRVEYVGGPNDGRVIIYTYDAAGNRTAVTIN